jgi:ABC-type amino acid transport substrate-binding protein
VNKALAELKGSGELQKITDKWMGGQAGAPELQ